MNEESIQEFCCASSQQQRGSENPGACCTTSCCSGLPQPQKEVDTPDEPATQDQPGATGHQLLTIEFLFLDLTQCQRCIGTNTHLEEAVRELTPILESTGWRTDVRKIHVESEEPATALGLMVSPTIRVNNQDIQLHWRESQCESCGSLCDCDWWDNLSRVGVSRPMVHGSAKRPYY